MKKFITIRSMKAFESYELFFWELFLDSFSSIAWEGMGSIWEGASKFDVLKERGEKKTHISGEGCENSLK